MALKLAFNPITASFDLVQATNPLSVGAIQFDTAHTPLTNAEGLIQWNSDEGTLNMGMPGGNVVLQVGQEHLIRVKNDSGAQINNGQAVYISGGTGNFPRISLADADTAPTSAVVGVATENIANNQHGYVTTIGLVRDINTNAWTAGTLVYLSSTAGTLTSTMPTPPAYVVRVGVVVRQHATEGVLFVHTSSAMEGAGDARYLKTDQTTPQTTTGTFQFPAVAVNTADDGSGIPLRVTGNLLGPSDVSNFYATQTTDIIFAPQEASLFSFSIRAYKDIAGTRYYSAVESVAYVEQYGLGSIASGNITYGGENYINGDIIDVGYGGAQIQVTSVGEIGDILAYDIINQGYGYTSGPWDLFGGTGINATFEVTALYQGEPFGIDLSWSPVEGANGYKIIIGDTINGYNNDKSISTTATSLSYTGTGVDADLVVNPKTSVQGGFIDGDLRINGFLNLSANNVTSGERVAGNNSLGLNSGKSSTYAYESNFFGTEAGAYSPYMVNANCFGTYAGRNAGASGQYCNYFGYGAGDGATGGSSNNFFGFNAGLNALNAYDSNFFGYEAGSASYANGSNFFGRWAGKDATNATGSNFFGPQCGQGALNAFASNFFGSATGYMATDAYYSNFFGQSAGENATAARYSNFFGPSAGQYATNANECNFFGHFAGRSAINAANSNFFGYYAGNGATAASSSNFYGTFSGNNAVNARFSIFIGLSSGNGATNASNTIFIGNGAGQSDTVNNIATSGTSIAIGNYSGTGGYSNSIALGRGIKNSAAQQANFGNILFLEGIYNSDVQSSTPVAGTVRTISDVKIQSDSKKMWFGAGDDMTAWYDGTNGNIKTSDVAASDLHIQCGTDKTVVLDETVWTDIDFPIIVRSTGTGIPSLTTMQGNITAPSWAVNDYNVCEGQELPHTWKEGTPLYFHIHLITNGLDATDRYVKFEVEYCWANMDGTLSAATTMTSAELLIPANTTTKTMKLFSIGSFTPTSGKIGGQVYARLKRVAATGTAPTNNPWVTMLQAHIENDTMGSRQIGIK